MQPPGILDTGHGEEEGGRVRGGEIETMVLQKKQTSCPPTTANK